MPSRGRIQGAILDFLRDTDPLTRFHRRDVEAGTLQNVSHMQLEWYAPTHSIEADGPCVEATAAREEARTAVRTAVRALPLAQRRVIVQRYFRERPMTGLCKQVGLGSSRMSQLHGQAVARLRVELSAFASSNGTAHQPQPPQPR